MVNISADYWLILCFLITDSLPVSALFPADVICYFLRYTIAMHFIAYYIISVYAACNTLGRLISSCIFTGL